MLKRVVQCLVVVVFTMTLWFYAQREVTQAGYEGLMPTEDSAVMRWMGYFSEGNLGACDTLVANSRDKFYNVSALAVMRDPSYYELVYTRLRETIDSIQLVETLEYEDYIEYIIEVRYYCYDLTDGLTYTGTELGDYCKEYYDGEDTNSVGFYPVLEGVYFDIFEESCFKQRSGAVEQVRKYSLYQRDGKVFGTVPFIKDMLDHTYIMRNIESYANEIQSYVKNLIESY